MFRDVYRKTKEKQKYQISLKITFVEERRMHLEVSQGMSDTLTMFSSLNWW